MDPAEYANLDAVEGTHWYYAGKRALVNYWLEKYGPPTPDSMLLDCGAGTGRFALEWQNRCRVTVLDDHEEALRLLRARFRPEQVISLSGDRVPLPDGSVDYITALDVLEHVPDDRGVVAGFHRLLKSGGITVITVPASMALWSDWDEALHHYRRYSRHQLAQLFPSSDWEIKYLNYTNVLAYPAVWLLRKFRASRKKRPGQPQVRSEDKIPPALFNAMLKRIFVSLGQARVPFPVGVSLILVARKK